MSERQLSLASILIASLCALVPPSRTDATGVPIGGYLPMLGIALTDEYKDDFTFFAEPSSAPGGMMLGNGGAHYDIALLDTGAAVSLLTSQAHSDFNMNGPYAGEPPDGHFEGTETIPIGGATGTLLADINDPLGLYAGGLQGRTSTSPLVMNHAALEGQTNTSLITIPPESDLPNVVGLTFASQYATYIRNDLPQVFQLDGHTVRTPHIEFLPLGSGGQGIIRRAPITLSPGASFQQPPFWFFNQEDLDIDHPNENPSQPTVIQGGLFLTVTAQNEGQSLSNSQFLFDTGADVTVVSEINAVQLGFDPVLDEPEFTVAVVGSGGTNLVVPGFFADQLTVLAVGGSLTLTNVPIVVLDVPDPSDPGNVVDGIIGTNIIAGRNAVIDPKPTQGGGVGPSLYIGDPVTTQKNWTTTAASGTFGTGGNWSGGTAPGTLGVANVRHVSGGNQTAIVSTSTTVWELNVSGTASQTMTVDVQSGVTLTTFSGINIEQGGVVRMQNSTLDTQFVEILGGALQGAGTIATGSGPIPGQVENRTGTVSPGNGVGQLEVLGRFANGDDGILEFELGGTVAGTQYDQLIVDGGVALDGTLDVSLVNLGGGMFSPNIGDEFTLITATDGLSGIFETLILPEGYQWDLDYNETGVILSVSGIGLAGDFNQDGVVNAADYVWLRKFGTPTDEVTWRTHFGESLPGSSPSDAVPEPSASAVALLIACLLALNPSRKGV
jgi:hypothetical protein